MAAPLRVHTLAKEIGVPSKLIIEKCRSEGIDLKNHMAAISVGLAESIREWFSAGADVTSVEVGQRVDLDKIRVRTQHKAADDAVGVAEAAPETEESEQVESEVISPVSETAEAMVAEEQAAATVPTGVAELPAETAPELPVETVSETLVEAPPPALEPEVTPSVAAPEPPAIAAQAPEVEEPPPAPVAPPEPITPAGPKLVPKPAELRGPRVIRVEAPEPDRYPRPRPAGFAARGGTERPAATAAGTTETTAPRKGRAKSKKEREEEGRQLRSRSPRRHGTTGDVDQRLREWRDQDLLERKERLASVTGHGLRDRRAAERRRQATQPGGGQGPRREALTLIVPLPLKEFCSTTGQPFIVVSKKLREQTGRLWTINQTLDAELVELLALEFGIPVQVERELTKYERLEKEYAERPRENLRPRPPVVAMLGHVDHGKTSLLDAIRKTKVAAGEAGGITQHIGAYRITRDNWDVTFVDTPGHEAFTAMRARGADLTDVVVLVVAADDGVMPQTVEALNHAKAAKVTIVVALNKIDLPGADPNRVYAQLAEHELTPSEWGGTVDVIRTSATKGEGIDALIAHLSTLSELLELKADPAVPARGTVIEAQMREGQGVIAQVLVREGTLKVGQIFVCGPAAGRVRALLNDQGQPIKEATPGTPVEVVGLTDLPASGDALYVMDDLAEAKEIAEEVQQQRREASLATAPKTRTLEALLQGGLEAEVPELRVIVRADVQGSVEVLKKTLGEFPAEKAKLTVLQAAVGAITEADVQLARASDALIIGFHVVAEDRARQLADQLGVEIRLYRVIYEILDDLQKALVGLLAPEEREEARASLEVRQVFRVSRLGTIAGCIVSDGVVNRHHRVRLVRDGRIIVEGAEIDSLKRFKDDAREVRAGLECGLKIAGYDDVKPGDVIQAYELVEVAQEL